MMRTVEEAKTATAGIVGRFQLPELHAAHQTLFRTVLTNHQRVVVLLGVTRILGKRSDPLDFIARKNMIEEAYPQVTCLPLADIPGNDEAWSHLLDDTIHLIVPIGQITLYGGRDSFVKLYSGKHRTVELDALQWESGTEIRTEVGKTPLTTAQARRGVIYLAENQYPRVNPVVDVAVLNREGGVLQVLLGQRREDRDGGNNWRFPGGFVDVSDGSLEAAARREVSQETGASVEHLDYVCSMPIKDGRMSGGDIIMTTFFKGERTHGTVRAGDDLADVSWFDLQALDKMVVYKNHWPLLEVLVRSELE